MKSKSIVSRKVLIIVGSLILTALFILREYFDGGVITHHLLADPEMPGASNWWGLLTVPLLAWIVLWFIGLRINKNGGSETDTTNENAVIIKRFLTALGFGGLISVLWILDQEAILPYLILLPVAVSLFIRVYWPECLLGFVIGMMYGFGGILPILVGLVLMLLSFLVFQLIRGGVLFLIKKLN